MKIFSSAVLIIAASVSSTITFSEAQDFAVVTSPAKLKDGGVLRRKAYITGSVGDQSYSIAATECPHTYTIASNGYPTYQTMPDCECTQAPYTVKEDVGAALGQPGNFRCSKANDAACSSDFECQLAIECIDGTCNGNGGVGQCPSTQGPNGYPLCENQRECECTDNGFTLKENLGTTAEPCYHCSKPMGADCSDRDECSALDFNNNVICYQGKCSVQCPRGQGLCGDEACVCPTAEFPLKEEAAPGTGCYRCVRPTGFECTHFSQCGEGATCLDGVCSTDLPNCNAYDNSGLYDFGGFVNRDSTNPPCQCGDPNYPDLLIIEFNSNSTIITGGGNFGYICSDGSVAECSHAFSFNEDGMAVRECTLESMMGSCACTEGEYTAKEELLDDCYRCAKPDGTTCSDDAECLYASHCDDGTNTCSNAPQTCNSYDGGDYDFGLFWDDDCGAAPCVCDDSSYPTLEVVEFDSDFNIVDNGGYCGYVCTADDGSSGLPNCNSYDGGDYDFGIYYDPDCGAAPCGCGDSSFPNLEVVEYDDSLNIVENGGNCGYVCTA